MAATWRSWRAGDFSSRRSVEWPICMHQNAIVGHDFSLSHRMMGTIYRTPLYLMVTSQFPVEICPPIYWSKGDRRPGTPCDFGAPTSGSSGGCVAHYPPRWTGWGEAPVWVSENVVDTIAFNPLIYDLMTGWFGGTTIKTPSFGCLKMLGNLQLVVSKNRGTPKS